MIIIKIFFEIYIIEQKKKKINNELKINKNF